ncbi:uncharacterized protein [Pseudorasbora parva]|uniref:uncharacterized protein n=1 Tax=Pseudorasbora parva TaxID=51549 RepID=UPI00351EFAF1
MACARQSAIEYLENARIKLIKYMKNFPLIIENLYQKRVFNDDNVDDLKAERTEFDKARCILDWVIKKGEEASYELLRILDVTKKRTLDPDLHPWISCFPFRWEDGEISYSFGTKPCQNYQTALKKKAKRILKDQRERCRTYLDEAQVNFHFIPVVLETDPVVKTLCKINRKTKKFRKLRPKKLRAYIPKQQALSPVDLLRCQDKNILLIGKPGIGKTTVVQEVLRLWAEKDDRELDYMFYFDESVLASSSNDDLESLLFKVYLKPMDKDRKDVFEDIEENSENVVIVLDGETYLEKNSTLWKILTHELLPDAKIIMTCRSEVEYDPLFSNWPTWKVYVQGFSEESINTYYQSMMGHNPVLLDVVLKNKELFSLSHVPMYASMIVDLIQFKNGNIFNHRHTVTEMYSHIFRVAVKKPIEQIDKYFKDIKAQVQSLMENAFNATMQKTLNLISCGETDICRAFLKMITIRDSPTSATTYCAFLHNTMQEFFSALWLLGHPDEIEKVLQLCQTEEHKHMRHVLPFLCGLLGEHNIKLIKCLFPEDQIKKTSDWFIEKFLETFLQPQSGSEEFDLLYVCQCLYELQSPKACSMFLDKMDHQLEPEEDLDPHQCCALAYVITQSTDKEVYLNLEDCNMTDTGMNMMLSCSSKIRLKIWENPLKQISFFREFFHKASQCSCNFFDVRDRYKQEQLNALLDLCSHVKNYETQTGRSFLPALQSVFQLPDVWIIDLSQRKTSVLLEVLKLQTVKKPVELRGCSEEESEMKSFLQCLPYISQLRFENVNISLAVQFVVRLFIKAAETETPTGEQMLKLLTSVCTYSSFSSERTDRIKQSDFLLDLCSHLKSYETQTGRSFPPALQSVFQSPDVWIIDLSERKTSVLLEVLKLQTVKKPVELRGCSEEESEMKSLLQCLPYISQLRFENVNISLAVQFVVRLFIKAAETETPTGEQMLKLLTSVCTYSSFSSEWTDRIKQSDFLLDLCSHLKNYETQTGRSFLPALQSVFQLPDVWIIDLSQRKTSVLLEVLKLQTVKKPVELRGCSEEESEMKSFLQCLPYISQLRFENVNISLAVQFVVRLFIKAAETETPTGEQMLKLLTSVCTYSSFPSEWTDRIKQSDFLLDLCSHPKNYETQTGRIFPPALQSVFQLPDVWIIDLSQRKTSVLLEVLKLQTVKKPVKLRGCSEEESEMKSFLQCLPYISRLRFWGVGDNEDLRMSSVRFLLKLSVAAEENDRVKGTRFSILLSSVCSYVTFPFDEDMDEFIPYYQSDFLLDLCTHLKSFETQTGRSFPPALQSVFQSPDVWIIDLSERKTSVLLEVLKLQTVKKPVELRGCSEEESEMKSLLQCLPYISQLRFENVNISLAVQFVVRLFIKAAETETPTGEQMLKLLTSVCTYSSFPSEWTDRIKQSVFLLDLCSHLKNYETQTGRSFPPALQSVFQSPDVWIIDLSERKTSVLLEVLKLQTEKKPVELRGCSEEESQMKSFLQCLPYISQLRFENVNISLAVQFVVRLFIKAAETETPTGEQMLKLLTSVCTYSSFPSEWTDRIKQSDFLLDLCSHLKNYETQTGRSFLPALQSVFQLPDVWIIDLSQRKTSVLLEVLKLQTVKKPVKLRGCSEEESEMKSFLQCLPYISQLRFENVNISLAVQFVVRLFIKAAETETPTGEQMLKLLTSVCTYSSFPSERTDRIKQSDFLLDLCSHLKNYETQTGRSFPPALQSVFQLPDVWIIDLSERKTSVLLEVLKLQTVKKPVELRGCSEEESEMKSFLQCLPYISRLRFWGVGDNEDLRMSSVRFLLKLSVAAEENDRVKGTRFSILLSSVCSYETFPFDEDWDEYSAYYQSDFLLDLCSHLKSYETQTGRSFLPALQSVFLSPDVWIIDLSERKTSVLLEVLKLQTVKKPVELRGCSEEESEMKSFLQCLPYISRLRFENVNISLAVQFVVRLFIKAAETETPTGEQMLKLLTSVCTYSSFSSERTDRIKQSDFLLDLCSHLKNYETQTGWSFPPALQSVFLSPDVWIIDLSQRKTSVLLEVLKLQTVKKPVELRGCSEEESQMKSFLQCLPYISRLRFENVNISLAVQFVVRLFIKAAETETPTGEQMLKLLTSVCTYSSFPSERTDRIKQSDFLLDLCSHLKNYETQTGWSFPPALQSVFLSPDVWIIDLSERKTSVLLEVLKLQTVKKPVELRGCSEEESEMKSFLQCLPYISQLRFWGVGDNEDLRMSSVRFLLKLSVAAEENDRVKGTRFSILLSSVCSYVTFPFDEDWDEYSAYYQSDFLLDLCSHLKSYETQTGRSFLPALQSVFQLPDVWIIDLSRRKTSVLLEVLKLQTVKKPVELRGCSEEESEMKSFLQCLPYISQLRFWGVGDNEDLRMSSVRFLLKLSVAAEENDRVKGTRFSILLSSVCSYVTFHFDEDWDEYSAYYQSDFLLDLCTHLKSYETQTGRSFLPALQSVFLSPDVWIIDLSQRKTSVLLEVLKLQTEKKPVELRGCSEEESEMKSFLQCLPYISQLRFENVNISLAVQFVVRLFIKAAETETPTGEQMLKLLTSVCTYSSFPSERTDRIKQSDFLLDLCSHLKNYETQTGRSFLPALQSVFQSPDVWIIDLSQRKTSVLLEVLKLQTVKKPVKLRGCSEEESEMKSLLQCLPYISQLRFWGVGDNEDLRMSSVRFLLKLSVAAEENDRVKGTRFSILLSSVCSYETFPFDEDWDEYSAYYQSDFLLDLCSHLKNYETQTGRSFLPALQSVFLSPDVWIIDLSRRKTSVLLEVLKLQTEKKPVELRGCSEEESEMKSLLQCLPYISQLRFENVNISLAVQFVVRLFIKAAETETPTGEQMLKLLTSVCTYSSFPSEWTDRIKQSDFLLDLCTHLKSYETQTGRSFPPALQSVFQLPDVWIIDLSRRKTSVLLEVLKLQTEKKPVELRGCSEEESEMKSFLQCLPYISQLRFENVNISLAVQFVVRLFIKAAETETPTGEQMLKLLTSVCTYSSFPSERTDRIKQSDFLLDLCSHLKNYETQTGRSFPPALQSVFLSPDVWIIDLSQRKTSVLLEVLKLQTVKKPVELRGCSEEESEMKSLLQCLPYISQLRFENVNISLAVQFVVRLFIKAAETETPTGEQMLKLLTSVCTYSSFPSERTDRIKQSDFLLDLCSHLKNYETQTGRIFPPALQSVFQLPDVWIIDLSQRKTSVLLEVLKLQTVKKPVELRGCSEEESEMKSLLQCLPYISRLRFENVNISLAVQFVVRLFIKAAETETPTGEQMLKLLTSVCTYSSFPSERTDRIKQSDFLLDLCSHLKNYETQTCRSFPPALQSVFQLPDVWIIDLSERKTSVLLEVLKLQTVKKPVELRGCSEEESEMKSFLQCLPYISQLRPSKKSLQKLVEYVYEAQEEELTQHFLQNVDGDLTSCSLSWEELHYFLQHRIQLITVDFRKSNIQCNIRSILPFLNRIIFKRMSSTFMLSVIREIYESSSVGFVSSLLSSVENYINLQSRELDSVHCAALRFTLQHCTAVSLNLLWTSIPEEELESIMLLFRQVSCLSVDRLLLLRMLHCCSVSDVQQEASALLLSVLQHKLDFSCHSARDLTANTDSETLHLTNEDCRVMSTVIQRAHTHTDKSTRLVLQDCDINTAGMDQLFPVLHSVKLCCDKSLLLQFLAHVGPEEAESLSRALGGEVDLSQTHLEPQVCRGLVLILEYSEGLTELDLSQCRLTNHSLDLLLPNLHKAQNIDFSGNDITDAGAQKIYSIVSHNSNIKTVRLFNNRIESRELFLGDPRFEIW